MNPKDFLKIKPRLKSCFFMVPYNDVIQIGMLAGNALEISNEHGVAEYCLSICNGKYSINEILKIIQKQYPNLKKQETYESLYYLYEEGVLENASESNYGLSANEIKRYERQLSFFNIHSKPNTPPPKEIQSKLKNLHVTLIGLGGGGNNIVQSLAAMGVGHIRGIDFDTIDYSNLNRQILFYEEDVGKYKTDIIKKRVKQMNPYTQFEIINERIDTLKKTKECIRNTDIVICSADGPIYDIYKFTDDACVEANIPWVSFGVVEQCCVLGPFVIPGQTKTYNQYISDKISTHPDYLKLVEYIKNNDEKIRKHLCPPSFLPMFTFCSSIICSDLYKWLSGVAAPSLINQIWHYDVLSGDIQKEPI